MCPSCHEVLTQPAPQQPVQQQAPQQYAQPYVPPVQQYAPPPQYMPPPPTMYTQQQYIPPQQPMKNYGVNIPLVILSIFNIVTGWCCVGGTILGIIALIMAIDRKDAKNDEEARKSTLLSLLFNVIALVVLAFAIIVPLIAFGGYMQMLEALS